MKLSTSYRIVILISLLESSRMLTGVVNAFFLTSRGVTLQQLAMLQMISSASVILFSIPIGLFADMVSRKLTTLIALCFIAAFYYLCLSAPNLGLLILGKILYAIGLSAVNYATDAWTLDAILAEYPHTPHMPHYFGHLKKEIAGFGNMITGLCGSIIAYTLGYDALYISSILLIFLLLLGFIWIPAAQIVYKKSAASIRQTMLTASQALFTNKQGLFYLLNALCITAVFQPILHFWQPLFVDFFQNTPLLPIFFREPILILGLTFVWVNAFILLLNYLFRKHIIQQFNHYNIGTVVSSIICICFMALYQHRSFTPWHSLLAFGFIHGFLTIVNNINVNQYAIIAPQKHLSSIFSFSHLMQHMVNIFVLLVIKHMLHTHHLGVIFAGCSIPMVLLSLSFIIGKFIQRVS
jgi:MFS family permease